MIAMFKQRRKEEQYGDTPRDYLSKKGELSEVFRHGRIRKERLAVDIHMGVYIPDILKPGQVREYQGYERSERWTALKGKELEPMGYYRCEGLKDSIIWWGVPVYLRITGGTAADLSQIRDKDGQRIYSQDTAATLNDVMTSKATENFMRGLGKTALPTMDVQKIIMVGILAVGAVFGLMMMGVF